jgi:hypothetical protein
MRASLCGWVCVVGVVGACGGSGSSSVPIDQIPPDEKLVDLSPGETQGVCDWLTGLAKQKLAGAMCNGSPITLNGCMGVASGCPATVSQYEACMPNFLDALASDPCQIIDFAFSMSDFESFVDGLPDCSGIGACVVSMP